MILEAGDADPPSNHANSEAYFPDLIFFFEYGKINRLLLSDGLDSDGQTGLTVMRGQGGLFYVY